MVLYLPPTNLAKVYYHFPDVRKMMGTQKKPPNHIHAWRVRGLLRATKIVILILIDTMDHRAASRHESFYVVFANPYYGA